MNLLNPERSALLAEERRLLADLQATLAQLPTAAADTDTLRQAAADLDALFLLVVVGEFNSGKSAFINALVGERILPEGVTPTTTAVNVVHFAAEPYERWLSDSLVERGLPTPWLRDLALVDTPGTNAVIRRHEEITAHFVPRSDLVLFVTSADRPFTESERVFLERVRHWGKKIVVVLNKIDLLAGEGELAEVRQFVVEHGERLLGFAPEVFPVSARLARAAKEAAPGVEREELWRRSRFAALERYVRETLDERERFRLKLLSPLGVAERLAGQYLSQADAELRVLREDAAAVAAVEQQIALYGEDVTHEFRVRLGELELIVHRLGDRGQRFFAETFRLARAFDLINADKVRGEFERKVVGDTAQQVEDAVRELSDWLVERERFLWRTAAEQLERRRAARGPRDLLGEAASQFEAARQEVLTSFTRTARQALASYDREAEAEELALSVRTAIAQTAVAEAGAVGLGALVAALATTAAVDVTGLLAAGLIAGLGLFILPLRRRRAEEEFRRKIDQLRRRLAESTTEEFRRSWSRTLERVREALGPYARFVRAEKERREAVRAELARLADALAALRRRLG